ncbi:MAG: bifunctional riboflavin kinase/FMN adenylyltransferase [Verrucomicrobia bacterium]|nr:MAG: bifunctional riboflavin kinase/FMN adenylyltransferase [Verrucomicrobiota bacterium]
MKLLHELGGLHHEQAPLYIAAGFFDGVHRGHQRVINEALDRARAAGGTAWMLTLDPHPLKVLAPHAAPLLLTTLPHKLTLIERLGISGCIVLPFTKTVADEDAEVFLRELAAALPRPAGLVVGANWTFGRAARGNVDLLRQLGPELGLDVRVVEPMAWSGAPISSTRIREQILRGHMEAAACMLGHFFSVRGKVGRGKGYGRQLGFPTANLAPQGEVLPPPGVYATYAEIDGVRYLGAAFRPDPKLQPEFGPAELLEVYFLDAHLDLYDRELEVYLLAHLRPSSRFDSAEALREQIVRDVAEVRRVTAGHLTPTGELKLPYCT